MFSCPATALPERGSYEGIKKSESPSVREAQV
jgi:hypothetical protein